MTEERLNRIEELILALSDNMIGFRRTVEERFDHLEIRIKTIELDVEPDGRISEGFERLSQDIDSLEERLSQDIDSLEERLSQDIDSLEKRLERLEHGQNRIQASLDIILRHITGYGQDSNQA